MSPAPPSSMFWPPRMAACTAAPNATASSGLLDLGDAGGASDRDHFVDIALGHARVLEYPVARV